MSSRVLLKTANQIILDEGDEYKLRATAQTVGAFAIVSIDWEHPNYGYFADAMLCFKSLHMTSWDAIPVVNWCWKYKRAKNNLDSKFLLKKFLKDYPELQEFFNLKTNIWDNLVFTEVITSINTKWKDVSKFKFEFTEDMLEVVLGKIKGVQKQGKHWLYKFEKVELLSTTLPDNWVIIEKIRWLNQKK